MKTWMAKPLELERKWWIVDASDKTVGRLATEVASVLRGKSKPQFTPHVDCGDFVVVVNADKVKFTGAKWREKKYYSHSGFFGNLKEMTAEVLKEKKSQDVVEHAVRGMLPRNRMGRQLIKKLKVYPTAEHPHSAQKPQTLNV